MKHIHDGSLDDVTSRVQEIMSDDNREAGRIPRTVECELTADLGMLLNGSSEMIWSLHVFL